MDVSNHLALEVFHAALTTVTIFVLKVERGSDVLYGDSAVFVTPFIWRVAVGIVRAPRLADYVTLVDVYTVLVL